MKILLISYDNDNSIAYFPLGLGYLASAIRNSGHHVEIYQQDIYHYPPEHLTEYLDRNRFDIVGLGACGGYYQYQIIKRNIEAVKKSKKKPLIILGGHLPSPEPEHFLRKLSADYVVIGEEEVTFVELIRSLEQGVEPIEVKSIAYINKNDKYIQTQKRNPIENADDIAWPAYDLFNMEQYVLYPGPKMERKDRTMVMLSGRGCPFKCNFCYRLDEGFRPRSAESLIKEITYLQENYKISYISFWDELLMSSVQRMYDFCKTLIDKNIKVRWTCSGRLNFASKDLKMLKLMKRAGCVFINYGIESMDDRCLRLMHKNLNTDMIVKGIENTIEAGISPGLNIIFGNIGEDRTVIEKDVEFLLKYDDFAQIRTIRPVTPYPGTELYNLAIRKGFIIDIEDFYENKHTNSDLLTCNFTEMTDDEFYDCLYWANTILLDNFINHLKDTTQETLYKLYCQKDPDFRGFRMV